MRLFATISFASALLWRSAEAAAGRREGVAALVMNRAVYCRQQLVKQKVGLAALV